MRTLIVFLTLALFLLPACTMRETHPAVHVRNDAGMSSDASTTTDASTHADLGTIITGDCTADATNWIYLVTEQNQLTRFAPATGAIELIGMLSCTSAATPFSMAVSRQAIADVLYNDGEVFEVSTEDASCRPTTFEGDMSSFYVFGMGYVSNAPHSSQETLFIAADSSGGSSSRLGTLDTTSWHPTAIGIMPGTPELTGNGNAELWGFFPTTTPMTVRQINKADGSALRTFDVSAVHSGTASPSAWAFAFWGGNYYIFYQDASETASGIYKLDPSTSAVTQVNVHPSFSIVGAGVSTCAPLG